MGLGLGIVTCYHNNTFQVHNITLEHTFQIIKAKKFERRASIWLYAIHSKENYVYFKNIYLAH